MRKRKLLLITTLLVVIIMVVSLLSWFFIPLIFVSLASVFWIFFGKTSNGNLFLFDNLSSKERSSILGVML